MFVAQNTYTYKCWLTDVPGGPAFPSIPGTPGGPGIASCSDREFRNVVKLQEHTPGGPGGPIIPPPNCNTVKTSVL
jgi:hypothetical protein